MGEWQARSQSSEAAALAAKTHELITLRDQLDRSLPQVAGSVGVLGAERACKLGVIKDEGRAGGSRFRQHRK